MDKKVLGVNLRQARRDKKMTSAQLATICNLNASYMRQIECGLKSPSLETFLLFCNTLDIFPGVLLEGNLRISDKSDLAILFTLFFREMDQNERKKMIQLLEILRGEI